MLSSRSSEAIDFLSVVARVALYQIIFPGILGEKWRTLLPNHSPCPLPDLFFLSSEHNLINHLFIACLASSLRKPLSLWKEAGDGGWGEASAMQACAKQ